VVNGTLPDATRETIRAIWPGDDPQSRALRLGYCGHALDFDDFHPDFRGHPGTVILPTLLALGTQTPLHLLDAFVVGVEMAGRLGLAVGGGHYVQGFHNTSTLGLLPQRRQVRGLSGRRKNKQPRRWLSPLPSLPDYGCSLARISNRCMPVLPHERR
jgi:hypothetical protein